MTKRKKPTKYLQTYEFYTFTIGSILIMLAILVFFATTETTSTGETPIIGKYLFIAGNMLFGEYYRWIFSPILLILGIRIILKKDHWSSWKMLGILLYYTSLTSIIGWYQQKNVGFFDIFAFLEKNVGASSALIFLLAILFTSLYLIVQISYKKVFAAIASNIPSIPPPPAPVARKPEKSLPVSKTKATPVSISKKIQEIDEQIGNLSEKKQTAKAPAKSKNFGIPTIKIPISRSSENTTPTTTTTKASPAPTSSENTISNLQFSKWELPSINLLQTITHPKTISEKEIQEKSLIIQRTFLQFGIDVEMQQQCVGPTVIQYRLKPSDGVHLTKIKNLKDNLVLALKAKSIRIQAPIPGIGLVGIEVPNDHRDIVGIRELIDHKNFKNHKPPLTLALGKDINGDFIVGDLEKMPHLLIAGQTGSGKSVGMNGFIISLLYRNSPSDLRMIMIDPKQVELGIYNGIPHLLAPVITTPEKSLNALKWSVAEMERRYSVFTHVNTRKIDEYNGKVAKEDALPFLVIIIDELGDLMLSGDKKEVERCIQRLAQKGRAAGIHLIVATQRPSVDVITGVIKANIPTRIAFTVSAGVDSKTILDTVGAEDLLGYGDMLYSPTGSTNPTRIQGVLVETEEVDAVVKHIRRTIDPDMLDKIYDTNITEPPAGNWEGSSTGKSGMGLDEDPKIIEQAIELVHASGKCSTTMLQRHLRLGYGRAARVIDILENLGVVGPANGTKPREIIG